MEILIISLLIATLPLSFISATAATVTAFAALVLSYFAGAVIAPGMLLFWGVATAIVVALRVMLPRTVTSHHDGMVYIAAGAVAGLFIGIAVYPSASAAAIIAGTLLGALAYSTTPVGRARLGFPSRKAVNYLCAKGLPVIVALTMAVTAFVSLRHDFAL